MQKKILLTGARSPITLDLSRLLSFAGHQVFVADTSKVHVCRFSNAVKKCFTFPSPRFQPQKFIETLIDLINHERFDALIPNWEEIFCIARHLHLFPNSCQVFCSDFTTLNMLHNKWLFAEKLKELGILVPKTYLVATNDQLPKIPFQNPFILKASYSRASQKVLKVFPGRYDLNFTISQNNPWLAQQWIQGKKFCSYSVCDQGEVRAHCTYPVEYSIDDSSCVTFRSVNHQKIYRWIRNFVAHLHYSGQISFDFIETDEGDLYAIECNPRATSGVHLFTKQDRLDKAFFAPHESLILPALNSKRQIAAGMVLYGWRSKDPGYKFSRYLKSLLSTKDVVFNRKDIKPFLLSPYVFGLYYLNSLKMRANLPTTFTYDLDYDNE